MLSLLILFLFTIFHEGMIIAYTIAVAERRKYSAALFSALIAPIQFISLLIIIESSNKASGIIAIAIACGISTIGVITIMNNLDAKKKSTKKRKKKTGKSWKIS